jgi:DNA-binding HxlR family transcriptional regulator
VLSARLGELADARVVEQDAGRRYRLSGRGRELSRVLYELNRWAEQPQQPGVSSRSELA